LLLSLVMTPYFDYFERKRAQPEMLEDVYRVFWKQTSQLGTHVCRTEASLMQQLTV